VNIHPGARLLASNGLGSVSGQVSVSGEIGAFNGILNFEQPVTFHESSTFTSPEGEGRFLDGTTIQSNQMVLRPGDLWESDRIALNNSSLLNLGGTLQFTTNSPSITGGPVISSNGIISFRNLGLVTTDKTALSNITFVGNSTLRLHNSTNAELDSYTFHMGSPYSFLQMIGGTNRWQSGNLTIGEGGELTISNSKSILNVEGEIAVINGGILRSYVLSLDGTNSLPLKIRVSGAGSEWVSATPLNFGNDQSFNLAQVENGALFHSSSLSIGSARSSYNQIWVVNPGSSFTNIGGFQVGKEFSMKNEFHLGNGAIGTTDGFDIGYSANQNKAVISGSGTVFRAGSCLIGRSGSSNVLHILNGAQAEFRSISLSWQTAQDNGIEISGAGSLLTVKDLYLGFDGINPYIKVTDGGALITSNLTFAGAQNTWFFLQESHLSSGGATTLERCWSL
jgi:hypothetical protein